MVTTRERTELRSELVGQGYSWEYVDGWQPKITLYRHAEKLNTSKEVVSSIGTKVENLPGNPDYVLRKARIGLLPYPPSDTCECRWCEARSAEVIIEVTEEQVEEPKESITCDECSEELSASTKAGAMSRLRVHKKTHQTA